MREMPNTPAGWYPHPSTGTTRYWDGANWGAPPAGWYPHPSMADTKRYWDGTAWTDHIAAVTPSPPRPTPAASNQDGLIAAGYITAILIPLIGFIIGIVLLAKGKTGHGIGALVLSVVAFGFWVSVLTPDAPVYYEY